MNKNEFWAQAFCAALPGVISTHSSCACCSALAERAKKIADFSLELYEKRMAKFTDVSRSEAVPSQEPDFERPC
jgi:hypothetical protein